MARYKQEQVQSRNVRHSGLPSDLRQSIARCYVEDREFKDDTGRVVKYSRLVVEFTVHKYKITDAHIDVYRASCPRIA